MELRHSQMLLGITGKAGSGKDTLADALIRKHGGVKVAFSDTLKAACKVLFQLSESQLYNRAEKERIDERWGRSPRQLMQFVGTDLLRNQLDKEIFIKSMRARVQKLLELHPFVVVADCRFENEAALVRDMGGTVIHLHRVSAPSVNAHVSEQQLPKSRLDISLHNDSSALDMLQRCENALGLT